MWKPDTSPEEICKGRIYRGKVEVYTDSQGRFIKKETLAPLKRLSCPGCQLCDTDDLESDFYDIVLDKDPLLTEGPGLYSVSQSYYQSGSPMDGLEYESEFVIDKIEDLDGIHFKKSSKPKSRRKILIRIVLSFGRKKITFRLCDYRTLDQMIDDIWHCYAENRRKK